MAAAVSAIDDFRERLKEYSELQTTLHDVHLNLIRENDAINISNTTISSYRSDNIKSAVKKLTKYKKLVRRLTPFTTNFQSLFTDVNKNNLNLENLRLQIEEAIVSAQTTAKAAAEAAAENAAAAQRAQNEARLAVDEHIQRLIEHKEVRRV